MSPRQANLVLDEWDQAGAVLAEVPAREKRKSAPEELFEFQCRQFQLPPFERQLQFAKAAMQRMWRFDFAFTEYWLAVEIEGLVPQRLGGQLVVTGRHGTVAGIIGDMEKYNSAALLGWTVLRFAAKNVKPRHALNMTMQVLAARGWKRDG